MRPSEVRISSIRSFVECSRYAIASMSKPWSGRIHVSSWIANAVHSRIVGVTPESKPDDLKYDQYTRTAERADESVDKIMGAIDEFNAKYEPDYMEHQLEVRTVYEKTNLTGRIDALAAIGESIVSMEIHTGRKPPAVWLKLALNAWILRYDKGIVVDALGSLHVPRVGPRTEQRWTYEERPFPSFDHDIAQWLWTLNAVRHAPHDKLAATPGQHCDRCPVEDCAIRAHPPKD